MSFVKKKVNIFTDGRFWTMDCSLIITVCNPPPLAPYSLAGVYAEQSEVLGTATRGEGQDYPTPNTKNYYLAYPK